ncbi:MAG TPA: hypothetical protein ENI63_01295 [Candidatus Kaiserbacteria bacterium]|nr:hypothetical protein [Candidatus Kaiserbacteria bacterium]
MDKISIVAQLNKNVIKEEIRVSAIVALYKITKEIINFPSILQKKDVDLDELHTALDKALERVLSISEDCIKLTITGNNLQGEPRDWVRAVLELKIFNKRKTQLTA